MAKVSALRHYRGERTQASIAEAVGIPVSSYSQIETGRRRLTPPKTARRIAEVIGRPMEDIFAPSAYTIRKIAANTAGDQDARR